MTSEQGKGSDPPAPTPSVYLRIIIMPGCLTLPPLPGGLQKQGSNLQAKMPTAYFTPDV